MNSDNVSFESVSSNKVTENLWSRELCPRFFSSYYQFDNGLPKIHEHDNKPPQAFGIFEKDILIVLYTYETDLGDGWEDEAVHNNPWELREKALKMGVNIIYFALTQ